MTTRQMQARRDAARAELRTMHDAANGGALAGEAQTRWDTLKGEIESLESAERRQALVDDLDRATPGAPLDGSGDHRFDELRNRVGVLATIRAQMRDFRDTREAGQVREVSAEIARRSGRTPTNGLMMDMRAPELRTLTTGKQGTAPNGAPLVPLVQRPDLFVDTLRNALVVERSGATVITDLVGDLAIARRPVQPVQPAFVLENTPLPLVDQSFDQLKMTPKTAGCVTELSRNMVLQSSPSAEALARDDMAKALAELIDRAALLGDGTGANPLGVIPQATTATYPKAGAPTWDSVLGALDSLEGANVTPSGWIIGPGVRRKLMQTPRNAAAALDFIMEDQNTLAGTGVLQTGILPAGTLLLGDFAQLIVGYWSAIEIVVNEFAQDAFMKGNVLVRSIVTVDVQVRRPRAFSVLGPAAT